MSIEHLKTVTRTARKPHRCNLCGYEIKKGEQYLAATYLCEGSIYDFLTHAECDELSSWLTDYIDPDEGITEDDFRDACSDVCQTFVCPDCEQYQNATVMFRAKSTGHSASTNFGNCPENTI